MSLDKLAAGSLYAARQAAGLMVILSVMAAAGWAQVDVPPLEVPSIEDVGDTVTGVAGSAPEINAGSLMSAIAIVGFAAMMIADRVRRK